MLEEAASAIPSSLWASMNSWFTPTVLFLLLNLMIGTIAITSSFSGQKPPPSGKNATNQNDSHPPNNFARSPSVLQRLKSVNFYANFRSHQPQESSLLHQKQNAEHDAVFETQANYFFQGGAHENGENVHQSEARTQTEYVFEGRERESTDFEEREREPSNFEERERESTDFEDFQIAREEEQEDDDLGSERSMDEVYHHVKGSTTFARTTSDTEPASGAIPAKLPTKMKKSASVKSAFAHFPAEDIVEVRRPATTKEKGNAKATDADEEVDAKADDFINRFKQQLKLQRLDSIIRYKDMIGRGGK